MSVKSILTKTADETWAGTENWPKFTIYKFKKEEKISGLEACTTNQLHNPRESNFAQGHTDTFSLDQVLGGCKTMQFGTEPDWVNIELSTKGYDQWLMEYALIFFTDNSYWRCTNTERKWLWKTFPFTLKCILIEG